MHCVLDTTLLGHTDGTATPPVTVHDQEAGALVVQFCHEGGAGRIFSTWERFSKYCDHNSFLFYGMASPMASIRLPIASRCARASKTCSRLRTTLTMASYVVDSAAERVGPMVTKGFGESTLPDRKRSTDWACKPHSPCTNMPGVARPPARSAGSESLAITQAP